MIHSNKKLKKSSKNKYKLLSLFSGAGGLDLGFELSERFKALFANDILYSPAETYAYNFHGSIINSEKKKFNYDKPIFLLMDASDINFETFSKIKPDILVGGPPCQDFSIVRGPSYERVGIANRRGKLYSQFIRALIHLQPKIFIFENVPGLKSANKGFAYKIILEDFSNLDVRWDEIKKIVKDDYSNNIKKYLIIFSDIINSANLGVPQKRKRLIIIGIREDLIQNNLIIFNLLKQEAENILANYNSLLKKYPLTPLEVFEGKTLDNLNKKYKEIMRQYFEVADKINTPRALEWKNKVWEKLKFDSVKDYLIVNNISPINNYEVKTAFKEHKKVLKELGYYDKNVNNLDFPDGSNTITPEKEKVKGRLKWIPPDENHLFVKGTPWEVNGNGMSLIYRRIHPLKPAYTIVAYGGGGTWSYHYDRNRSKLTNRERARLQTFPDWFLFKGSITQIRAQIGEAVPVLLSKNIGQLTSKVLDRVNNGFSDCQ